MKEKIPKRQNKIKKILSSTVATVLAFALSFSLNGIDVHAGMESEAASAAASIVDSLGSSNSGGSMTIQNGISTDRTGYLCRQIKLLSKSLLFTPLSFLYYYL